MYLDPGFGGMLLQIIVAIAATGGILIFSLRKKIRALFSKKKDSDMSKVRVSTDASDLEKDAVTCDDDVIDMLTDENTADENTADK